MLQKNPQSPLSNKNILESSKKFLQGQQQSKLGSNRIIQGSHKNLIPVHSKTNIARRQSLNYIEDLLNETRKLNSIQNIQTINKLSSKNIEASFRNNERRGSTTFNNVLQNIAKFNVGGKHKKKRRKKEVESSDSDYERKKPQLQMIEVDPMLKSQAQPTRQRQRITQQVDNFLQSLKSIGSNNRSRNRDISILNDLQNNDDNLMKKSNKRKSNKYVNKNRELGMIKQTSSMEDIIDKTSYTQLDNKNQTQFSKGYLDDIRNKSKYSENSYQSEAETPKNSTINKQNKDNIYSFRGKKQNKSSDSQFDDQFTLKTPSLNNQYQQYPNQLDYLSQSDDHYHNKSNIFPIKSKQNYQRFQIIAQNHPDYNLNISRKQIGQMLYRIRNRIMVSMISIHHMQKQHPTTNQEQINSRFHKQTKDVQQIAHLLTSRPRWNSPQGLKINKSNKSIIIN